MQAPRDLTSDTETRSFYTSWEATHLREAKREAMVLHCLLFKIRRTVLFSFPSKEFSSALLSLEKRNDWFRLKGLVEPVANSFDIL